MEKLSRNMGKALNYAGLKGRIKKDNRWTVFFIGDHGKVHSIKRFKGLTISAALVILLAITAAIAFFVLYQNTLVENRNLKNKLKVSKQQFLTLRDEKDLLMSRLVVSESKLKSSGSNLKKNVTVTESAKIAKPAESFKNSLAVSTPKAVKTPKHHPIEIARPVSVKIENLAVTHLTDTHDYRTQFKIRNTGSHASPASGHSFVVLKNEDLEQDQWLTMPPVALIDGKPGGNTKGQFFSIYRFKTVKFKTRSTNDHALYDRAAVYIYSTAGDIIYEKEFPIIIKARRSKPLAVTPAKPKKEIKPPSADAIQMPSPSDDTTASETESAALPSNATPSLQQSLDSAIQMAPSSTTEQIEQSTQVQPVPQLDDATNDMTVEGGEGLDTETLADEPMIY